VPGRKATITLANATTTGTGTLGPDGTLVPLAQDRLVYVITYVGVPCFPVGPPQAHLPATPGVCTEVTLVDAQTGAELYSFSEGHF
jgi:hypothetical protein